MHPVAAGTNNFLIPNGTFFFEFIVFLLVLWFIYKKALPPITAMLEKRQETIRQQFADAEEAKRRLEQAESDLQAALAETRREATRLREEAASERAQILDEARADAARYRDEQSAALEDRLAAERVQVLNQLRGEIGDLAATLAERIVHTSLRDDARQRQLIADFIAGVGTGAEAGAGSTVSQG